MGLRWLSLILFPSCVGEIGQLYKIEECSTVCVCVSVCECECVCVCVCVVDRGLCLINTTLLPTSSSRKQWSKTLEWPDSLCSSVKISLHKDVPKALSDLKCLNKIYIIFNIIYIPGVKIVIMWFVKTLNIQIKVWLPQLTIIYVCW